MELLASFPVVWHHSLTCDLALALMLFPPRSSGCHCLLHLSPQLTLTGGSLQTRLQQLLQERQVLCRVPEPFPPSKVALGQASLCDKPSSQAWDSLLSFLCTLLT